MKLLIYYNLEGYLVTEQGTHVGNGRRFENVYKAQLFVNQNQCLYEFMGVQFETEEISKKTVDPSSQI